LETIRRTGIAFDRDENAVGIHCAAAPVIVDGKAVCAISVTGSPTRLQVERVAPAVKTAALGLARKLKGASGT
jgi:IclR family transcriptional regulator, acetate operon repressor